MVSKDLDIGTCAKDGLSRCTLQDRLFANKLSLFLRKIRFNEQEFLSDKSVSDVKYHHFSSQKDNLFYPFNNLLDYALANYFADSETTKANVDRFLSNP